MNLTTMKRRSIGWLLLALLAGLFFLAGCGGDMGDGDFAPPPPTTPAPATASPGGATQDSAFAEPGGVAQAQVPGIPNAPTVDGYTAPGGEYIPLADTPQGLALAGRMVIRNANISIDTLYFDDTLADVERIAGFHGGFIEMANTRMDVRRVRGVPSGLYWYGNFTLRVPVARFDQVNRELSAIAQVTHFTTASEDVTQLFADMQGRLRIREEEERRLQAMRDLATSLTDILRLEQELTTLRLHIDHYRRRMTEIDELASFSTIHVALREVTEAIEPEEEEAAYIPYVEEIEEEPGFGGRISAAFSGSVRISLLVLEGITIVFAAVIMPLLLLAIPALAGLLLWRKFGHQVRKPS